MFMKQLLAAFGAVVLASLLVSAQGIDFAYYKLSLTWPRTTCNDPRNKCKTPIPTIFTIHGLWPTFANNKPVPPYGPDNRCNANPTGADAAVAKLAPIKTRLDQRWPNLFVGKSNADFWKIEWEHHGMCSDYPQDPLGYFTDTLNLAESSKYDPFKALGVQPSNTPILLNTLLENVYKNVGAYPQIACSSLEGKLYLREIRFCLKRTKKTPPSVLQNCPMKVGDKCTDPLKDNVLFPPAN